MYDPQPYMAKGKMLGGFLVYCRQGQEKAPLLLGAIHSTGEILHSDGSAFGHSWPNWESWQLKQQLLGLDRLIKKLHDRPDKKVAKGNLLPVISHQTFLEKGSEFYTEASGVLIGELKVTRGENPIVGKFKLSTQWPGLRHLMISEWSVTPPEMAEWSVRFRTHLQNLYIFALVILYSCGGKLWLTGDL